MQWCFVDGRKDLPLLSKPAGDGKREEEGWERAGLGVGWRRRGVLGSIDVVLG